MKNNSFTLLLVLILGFCSIIIFIQPKTQTVPKQVKNVLENDNDEKFIIYNTSLTPPPNPDCMFYKQDLEHDAFIKNLIREYNIKYRVVKGDLEEYGEMDTETFNVNKNSEFLNQNERIIKELRFNCLDSDSFCIYNITKNKLETHIDGSDTWQGGSMTSPPSFNRQNDENLKQKIKEALSEI